MREVEMVLQSFLDFPWAQLGAFFGTCIAFLTLSAMLMPRVGKLRIWIGGNIQDMLGIGGLRKDMNAHMGKVDEWITIHTQQAQARDEAITRLATAIGSFVSQAADDKELNANP